MCDKWKHELKEYEMKSHTHKHSIQEKERMGSFDKELKEKVLKKGL